eukprot:366199-Chlamydomonas_euryale.AAC.5
MDGKEGGRWGMSARQLNGNGTARCRWMLVAAAAAFSVRWGGMDECEKTAITSAAPQQARTAAAASGTDAKARHGRGNRYIK